MKSGSKRSNQDTERKGDRQWSVQRLRADSASAPVQLIFKFPTSDGQIAELRLAPSELRHPQRLMDRFADFMPVFPAKVRGSDAKRVAFIKQLLCA